MRPTLHVLLGGGGVGKTTLAAGYALALARAGRHVGLLGIDPSRRLHDALGLELSDLEAPVPQAGHLKAAILAPHQAMRRWAAADCESAEALGALQRNPFFLALTDRLASATDALAAARIAEWAEVDPSLTDLVVDTAPGVSAIGFLRYPRDIERLLQGRLVGWLRAASGVGAGAGGQALRFSARRMLGALGRIAGRSLVGELADFFALVGGPLGRLVARLQFAQGWLSGPDAELLLVTSPRDAQAAGAAQLAQALGEQGLRARATLVNRTWPSAVVAEFEALEPGALGPAHAALARYAREYSRAQRSVIAAATGLAPRLLTVPSAPGLAVAERRELLLELGEVVRVGLQPAAAAPVRAGEVHAAPPAG